MKKKSDLFDDSRVVSDVDVCDFSVVDDDVLHAPDEAGPHSGQHFVALVNPAQVGVFKDGVFLAHRVDGVGGLDPFVPEQDFRRGDEDVGLLPLSVVQFVPDHYPLELVDQVRMKVQFSAKKNPQVNDP